MNAIMNQSMTAARADLIDPSPSSPVSSRGNGEDNGGFREMLTKSMDRTPAASPKFSDDKIQCERKESAEGTEQAKALDGADLSKSGGNARETGTQAEAAERGIEASGNAGQNAMINAAAVASFSVIANASDEAAKNPLMGAVAEANVEIAEAAPSTAEGSTEGGAESTDASGLLEMQAILSGMAAPTAVAAAPAAGSPQTTGAAQALTAQDGARRGRTDAIPGMLNLVEKLQASSETGLYDAGAWLEKPVREIMKEIKENREGARTGMPADMKAIAEMDGGTGMTTGLANTANGAALEEAADGSGSIGIEGMQPVGSDEATEFIDALGQKSGSVITDNGSAAAASGSASTAIAGTAAAEAPASESVNNSGKPEAYAQIGGEILAKLEQKGPMEFRMQLAPENLGNIDIQLKVTDGKLIIDIMAASKDTQKLLISQVDQLVANLGLSNVKVETVNVSQQNATVSELAQQMMAMGGGMEFSHRGSRDQSGDRSGQAAKQGSVDNTGAQAVETVRTIRSLNRRMDYAI